MRVSTKNNCFPYLSYLIRNNLKFLARGGLIGRWFSVPLRLKAYLLAARLLTFTRILIRPRGGLILFQNSD